MYSKEIGEKDVDYYFETLKKKYIDIVRNNFIIMQTNDPLNKQACEDLMDVFKKMKINSFYKFKSLASEYTIPNLENNVFHFSLISQLNDPFEYSYKINTEEERRKRIEILKYIKFIEEPLEQELESWINTDAYKIMNAIREYTLVYSLTTSFDNAPMWAAYANDYDGVCIEYDAIDIFVKYNWRLTPIEYTEMIPRSDYSIGQNEMLQFIHRTCIAKNNKWRNEDEWRITYIQYSDKKKERNDIIKPKSIIMGNKVSEENRKKLFRICASKDIKLYVIDVDSASYQLVRKQIN